MNEGILPHVGQFHKLKKRFIDIRKDINYSKKIEPNHSFSQNNNSLIVKNKLSRYPQIYSLFCDEKLLDEVVLVRNFPREIKFQELSNCPTNNILFSIDRGFTKKNINLILWMT